MILSKKQTLILAGIILLGFFIRWGTVNYLIGPPIQSYPTLDEMNFRELAGNILDHRTFAAWTEGFYTTATRAPIYPLMLASAYFSAGKRTYDVPKYLNLIFDTLNILLIFVLAGSLFREKMGLAAAGFYAVFGHAPYFMAVSSPHTLGLMLLLLVCIAITCIRHAYWKAIPALSIVYGLLLHTRPVFLVILPLLLPAIWLQLSSKHEEKVNEKTKKEGFWWLLNNWKIKCYKSILPIIVIALLCSPWMIRNYRLHNVAVPVCIIAGWHIASNENPDMKLSIKYLTDQLYAPGRENFTEGDYFASAKKILFKTFWHNPLKFIGFGIARLVYSWSPPGPFYRFISPKAYVFPIKIFNGYILPLPDFEGMIYLFIFSTLCLLFVAGWKVFGSWLHIFYRARGIVILMAAYTSVHIIGPPLIAYRFLIEPLILIILIQIASQYARMLKKRFPQAKNPIVKIIYYFAAEKSKNKSKNQNTKLITLYSIMFILGCALILPFFHKPKPFKHTYFAPLLPNEKVLTYSQLRDMQWQNRGDIKENTIAKIQGQIRYAHPGFKYINDDYYAIKTPDCNAARLYVLYGDSKHPLGIGDIRLNFPGSVKVENGNVISVTGKASTGPFKEIILDVMDYQVLK